MRRRACIRSLRPLRRLHRYGMSRLHVEEGGEGRWNSYRKRCISFCTPLRSFRSRGKQYKNGCYQSIRSVKKNKEQECINIVTRIYYTGGCVNAFLFVVPFDSVLVSWLVMNTLYSPSRERERISRIRISINLFNHLFYLV